MRHPFDPIKGESLLVVPQRDRASGRRVLINTGALAGANLWRIAASFLLQIWIVRQLGVEALGVYTIAMAYLNVCQVLSELGLPTLLVRDLAAAPEQRRSYMRAALALQLAASLLVWGALILWASLFSFSAATRPALWLIGASLPFYAVTSVTQTIFQAAERMDLVMGIEMVINTLILAASGVVLSLGGDVVMLAGVIVVTQLISALAGLWMLARASLLAVPQRPADSILTYLRTNGGVFFGLSLGDVLLQRLDILLLSLIAGETVTGVYSAAYALVRVIVKLVQSGWKAVYPTLSRLRGEDQARYAWLAATGLRYGLLGVWLVVAAGAGMAGPLLAVLFGRNDAALVWAYRVLLLSAPLLLCETYAITLLLVEHRPRRGLLAILLHLVIWALLLPWMAIQWQAAGAAVATVLSAGVGAGAALYLLAQTPVATRPAHLLWAAVIGILAAALAAGLPWPPGMRLVAALAGYTGLVWYSGLVTASDIAGVRSALFGSRA